MPANRKLPHHLFENIIILIKISHHPSLFHVHGSLSPSLSSHVIFSLILTFFFSLPFVSAATTLKQRQPYALLYTGLLLMSHLNPSPNQTKTQSKRQNRSERNREERSKRRESESERRERGRCSQPHTTRRRRRSLAHNPQPISLARDHSTTAPQPSDHPTTATTKPPTQRRHHRERLAERALI